MPLIDDRMGCIRFLSTPSARRATVSTGGGENVPTEFLSTPSARRATHACGWCAGTFQFLSTPSARRATQGDIHDRDFQMISIHALREEGDQRLPADRKQPPIFLSTPSARRATNAVQLILEGRSISIHALREEGDLTARGSITPGINFYPRPPRGGRRQVTQEQRNTILFLSTPSARRATPALTALQTGFTFLSTPSARRATSWASLMIPMLLEFLSTPSARRATDCLCHAGAGGLISIHALREEGDPEHQG